MATSSSSTVSLKLLIDTKRQKVLFAEAGKDSVDFLFTLLSLPVGTVIRLLSKDGMVGSFGKLYESVEKLNDTYMQPNLNKDVLLKPRESVAGSDILKLSNTESSGRKAFYTCASGNYHRYVSDDPKAKCSSCNSTLSSPITYVAPANNSAETSGAAGVGFVKGVVTYMIMDDLEVKPMSTISSITLLNRFNVKDVGGLQERVVNLGRQEGCCPCIDADRLIEVLKKKHDAWSYKTFPRGIQ